MSSHPPSRRLRVGLLGCGRIARRVHLPVLSRIAGVELAAVAEIDPGLRESCRALCGATTWVADYRELLDRRAVDAVVICLPTPVHAEAAVACFEQGLHVYLEKPLATAMEDGDRVIAAWRRAGTVGAIGFNLRFHPLAIRLRRAIAAGELGEVIGAQTAFAAARRVLPEWKRTRSTGGGALLDLAGHHVDLARFVFGSEIVEVAASVRSVATEDDTAVLDAKLASGPRIATLVSITAVEEDRFAVYGSAGALVLDRFRSSRLQPVPAARALDLGARLRAGGRQLAAVPRLLFDAVSPPRENSFAVALAGFARAARGDGEWSGADLEDARRSLAVVAAAERSAASGTKIVLGEPSA